MEPIEDRKILLSAQASSPSVGTAAPRQSLALSLSHSLGKGFYGTLSTELKVFHFLCGLFALSF